MNNINMNLRSQADRLRAAARSRDISQLAVQGEQLAVVLASAPSLIDQEVFVDVQAALHEAMTVCHTDSEWLVHRLAILAHEHEGNMAYIGAREWDAI